MINRVLKWISGNTDDPSVKYVSNVDGVDVHEIIKKTDDQVASDDERVVEYILNNDSDDYFSDSSSNSSSFVTTPLRHFKKEIIIGTKILDRDWQYGTVPDGQPLPFKYKGAEITNRALLTLRKDEWLEDEIMNAWMELLQDRSDRCVKIDKSLKVINRNLITSGLRKAADSEDHLKTFLDTKGLECWVDQLTSIEDRPPAIQTFNTFFWSKLCPNDSVYDYNAVRRWTSRKKIDIFNKDILLIPVHVTGSHWALGVIHMVKRKVYFLDSLTSSRDTTPSLFAENAKRWIIDEDRDKRKGVGAKEWDDEEDWKLIRNSSQERRKKGHTLDNPPVVPQQTNGNDCGVFTCWHAECVADGRWFESIDFTADDMDILRPLMAHFITAGRIGGIKWKDD